MHEAIPLPYNKDNLIVILSFIFYKGGLSMSFWEQMAKTIDAGEEKKKKEDLYQKTFHELAEKLSEIRNKEMQDKVED